MSSFKLVFGFLVGMILLFGTVQAEFFTTFNNSASADVLYFSQTDTQFTGLRLPKNASLSQFINSTMNITGLNSTWYRNTDKEFVSGQEWYPEVEFNFTGDGNWSLLLVSSHSTSKLPESYYWNGTDWVNDDKYVVGITSQQISAIEVEFNITGDRNWTLIEQLPNGTLRGYYWNGSGWALNGDYVRGIDQFSVNRGFFTMNFNITSDDNWTMYVWDATSRVFGYYWNGSRWINDNTSALGLPVDVSTAFGSAEVEFNVMNDSNWTLFYSCCIGNLIESAHYWNGSGWTQDNSRVEPIFVSGNFPKIDVEYGIADTDNWTMVMTVAAVSQFYVWMINNTFIASLPSDIHIDVGNDSVTDFNFTNELNLSVSPQVVSLNSSAIINYLASCTADANGLCDVPIRINTSSRGVIVSAELNIAYDVNNTLVLCGVISNTTAINFTFFREENNTIPLQTDAELELDVYTLDRTFSQNITFNSVNQTFFEICIFPSFAEYIVKSTLKYTNNDWVGINYSTRYHFFQNANIDNITDIIALQLLEASESNQITFIIKNVNNIPQADIIAKATRFFILDDVYRQVDMGLSDFDGKAVMQLKLNEWYIFIIEQNGLILRTYPQKFITTADDIDLITEEGTSVEYFEYFDTIGAACVTNNVTEVLNCIFSDTSGRLVRVNLSVEKRQLVGGYTTICTNTSTSSAGTLSCSYSGNNDSELFYILRGGFCCSDPTTNTILTGNIPPALFQTYGSVGIILIIIVMMVTIGFGTWNPIVPIIGGLFSLVLGFLTGALVVGYVALVGQIIAGGILIWKMKV